MGKDIGAKGEDQKPNISYSLYYTLGKYCIYLTYISQDIGRWMDPNYPAKKTNDFVYQQTGEI